MGTILKLVIAALFTVHVACAVSQAAAPPDLVDLMSKPPPSHISKHVVSGVIAPDGSVSMSQDVAHSMPKPTSGGVRDAKKSGQSMVHPMSNAAPLVRKHVFSEKVAPDGSIELHADLVDPLAKQDSRVVRNAKKSGQVVADGIIKIVPSLVDPILKEPSSIVGDVEQHGSINIVTAPDVTKPKGGGVLIKKTPPGALTGFSYVGYGQCNAWHTRQFMGTTTDNLQCKKTCENRGLVCGGYSIMDDKFTGIRDGHGNANRSYASNDNRCYWFRGTVTGVSANARTQGTHGFYTEVAYCYGRQTSSPTEAPTASPTDAPTVEPTESPTESPTDSPTGTPTDAPTESPTAVPPTSAPSADPNTYWYSGASGGWGGECKCPNGVTYVVGDKRINGQMTLACYNGEITIPREFRYAANRNKRGWEVRCGAAGPVEEDNYFLGSQSGGWGGECTCRKSKKTYIVGDLPPYGPESLACYNGDVTKERSYRYAANAPGGSKKGWEVHCAM